MCINYSFTGTAGQTEPSKAKELTAYTTASRKTARFQDTVDAAASPIYWKTRSGGYHLSIYHSGALMLLAKLVNLGNHRKISCDYTYPLDCT